MEKRLPEDFYYLGVAESVSKRSTCLNKHYGAVIVNNHEIIATGYNGAPRGRVNCCDRGVCFRIENHIPRGTRYETCRSAHAEANAIISASRVEMLHGDMYLYGYDVMKDCLVDNINSCSMCKRLIINAGIDRVIFADPDIGIACDGIPYKAKFVKVEDWITNDDSLSLLGGY